MSMIDSKFFCVCHLFIYVVDAMKSLKVESREHKNGDTGPGSYPGRPGEPDCIYYLRTGTCGYGTNCRFNHPPNSGQVNSYSMI